MDSETEAAAAPFTDPVTKVILHLYSRLCVIRNTTISGEEKMARYYDLARRHLEGTGVSEKEAHDRSMEVAALMGGLKRMKRDHTIVDMNEPKESDCMMCDG